MSSKAKLPWDSSHGMALRCSNRVSLSSYGEAIKRPGFHKETGPIQVKAGRLSVEIYLAGAQIILGVKLQGVGQEANRHESTTAVDP